MQQTLNSKKGIDNKSAENKIAIITKPKALKYLPYVYDSIGPDEVLVKMIGCGLDHSDILLWEGREWIDYPLPSGTPGREGWGVVEKAGELTPIKKGDTVAVFASNALANLVICKHHKVHKIPDAFRDINFPAKAFGYAVNIFNQVNVQEDQVIAVLGNGFVSTILCYLINKAGAVCLKVANGGKDKFADKTFSWQEIKKLNDKINKATKDKGCDILIECTGTMPACELATSLLRDEGKLILARQSKDRTVKIDMEDPCGMDIIFAYDQGLRDLYSGVDKAVELVEQGKLNPDDFITKSYSFDQLKFAMEELCSDVGEYNKSCIKF